MYADGHHPTETHRRVGGHDPPWPPTPASLRHVRHRSPPPGNMPAIWSKRSVTRRFAASTSAPPSRKSRSPGSPATARWRCCAATPPSAARTWRSPSVSRPDPGSAPHPDPQRGEVDGHLARPPASVATPRKRIGDQWFYPPVNNRSASSILRI